jgi:hypothetical protein
MGRNLWFSSSSETAEADAAKRRRVARARRGRNMGAG